MAGNENFAEAWLNADHKVFGLKLRPFSNWHKFLLLSLKSPILENKENVSISDVYMACVVCRQEYPEAKLDVSLLDTFRVWRYRKKTTSQFQSFMTYLNDYVAYPEFWESEEQSGKKRGAPPEPLSAMTSLINMGFSEKEAWDMPTGKAYWYVSAYAQSQGADIDFITADEMSMQDEWAAIQAEMDAKEAEFKKNAQEFVKNDSTFDQPQPHMTHGRS